MNGLIKSWVRVSFWVLVLLFVTACGPRVIISTGTTIGLKATPGDGNTRPPQVALAYKRSELALVPTSGTQATEHADAFSTLATINFFTEWFGRTHIQSVLGTGFAARDLQGGTSAMMMSPSPSGQSEYWKSFCKAVSNCNAAQ